MSRRPVRELRRLWIALVLGPLLGAAEGDHASAQSFAVGDPLEEYLRVLQIVGVADQASFTVRPLLVSTPPGGAHPWSARPRSGGNERAPSRLDVEARVGLFANTRVPRGWNDGAVWQGRGVTSLLETTASARWKALSVTLDPTVLWNQNASFDLAPVAVGGQPAFAYPWRTIDWPQRFGADPYWTFDPGQSRIALDWGGARLSFGNESLWWGPGVRSAIVMSNNAPGFLHTSLATSHPVDIGIGKVEAQWIWGGLRQSDVFDPSVETDRYVTGLVVAYSPDWLEGLTVGGTRIFQSYVPAGGIPFGDYFLVFQGLTKTSQFSEERPEGNDEADQMVSLFARWVFPESGAEIYAEWARTDHALDFEDFFQEPEHSQGYTLGLQKVTSQSADRIFVITGELTHLEASATFQLRPRPTYYQHSVVQQGHTQKGQILGSWVGPGGNSQYLGFEMYDRWGSAELFIQRQVHDNDAFWVWAEANDRTFDAHHVSFDAGLNALLFRGDLELLGGAVLTRQINRWFFGPHLWNLNVSLSARWRPTLR